MYIFRDRVHGDIEVLTDAFKMKLNGILYEVPGKMVADKAENNFDIGANPSAEEQTEELESGETMQFDLVKSLRLEECPYIANKKALVGHFKEYMKKVIEFVPEDEVEAFRTAANTFVKEVATNFKDYVFFVGADADVGKTPLLIPMKYNDDGLSGTFYFLKAGLLEEKL